MSKRIFNNSAKGMGPTLEWESLPIVGEDQRRHHDRAEFLTRAAQMLILFWGIVAIAIVALVMS